MSAGNVPQLVSAVLVHADRHYDTEWDTVSEAMTRDEIGALIMGAGAHTPKQAVRAIRVYLGELARVPLASDCHRELVGV